MAQLLFGTMDQKLGMVAEALTRYEADHPGSEAALYRQNSVSVRLRVIDPSFAGLSKGERGKRVWPYLRDLPEEVRGDFTVLLLLAPQEVQMSFADFDFTHPMTPAL